MNSATSAFYTNQVPADFLRTFDKSPFTEQQLCAFNEQALATIKQQQEYKKSHPPIAIYRIAVEGSQPK